jgi:hypothetical protein
VTGPELFPAVQSRWRVQIATSAAVALAVVSLVGCGSSDAATSAGGNSRSPGALPATHIHGIGIDPADGALLLATHDGLFEVGDDGTSVRVGP